jgi:hypothetical protein
MSSGGARAWSRSSDFLVVCSGRFLQCSVLLCFVHGCFRLAAKNFNVCSRVSREVCASFRLFVCDSRSCNWDIG